MGGRWGRERERMRDKRQATSDERRARERGERERSYKR